MSERFSENARLVLRKAKGEAGCSGSEKLEAEHLLFGIMKTPACTGYKLLELLGISMEQLSTVLSDLLPVREFTLVIGRLPRSDAVESVIRHALNEARQMQVTYIGTEHILLGLWLLEDGVAHAALKQVGFDYSNARAALTSVCQFHAVPIPSVVSLTDAGKAALVQLCNLLDQKDASFAIIAALGIVLQVMQDRQQQSA